MVIRTDQNKGILTLIPGKGEREPKVNREVLFSFFLLMLAACPLWGQVTLKKSLTPKDYHRWSTLFLPQISDNGQWVSYTKQYDYGQDTLFIQSTEGDTQYVHPGGGQLEFTADGDKAVISKEGALQLQNLGNGDVEDIGTILGHEMVLNGTWLLIKKEGAENSVYNLEFRSLKTGITFNLMGVDSHLISPKGDKLLYITREKGTYVLHLLDLGPGEWEPVELLESRFPFQQLTWGPSGNSIAFLQKDVETNDDLSLYFYKIGSKTNWFRLDGQRSFGKEELQLADYRLLIAPDDSKVLFGLEPQKGSPESKGRTDDETVELWHAHDKIVYPRRQLLGLFSDKARVWAWWPTTQKMLQLSTSEHPYAIPTPGFDHAIIYNPWDNEPQYKLDVDRNFYLKELATGKQQLLEEKMPYWGKYLGMSEDGNYLKYFKDGNWWVYHIKNKVHINLTQDLKMDWTYLSDENKENVIPYGSPGWAKDGKSVLIYDKYDIWQISSDGKKNKRLTNGRREGFQYRIYERLYHKPSSHYFSQYMEHSFNLEKGVVLEGFGNDLSSGYFLWNAQNAVQTLVNKPKRIYGLAKAKDTQDYIYLEETFEEPTRLVHLKMGQYPKTLAIPNAFQSDYVWGRSSLISYKNKAGEKIQGVLIHPSDYDPGQKYPMMVYIYEQQQYRLFEAVVPSEQDMINPSILAAQGYIVLYPDIHYEIGKTGESALDCVVSAVKKVVDMGLADPKRIGLYGASFGGFETTYIISQTDIFATAIAGAAVTDLVSSYLSISKTMGQIPEAWRYENDQFRLRNSFTDNFQSFIENSPVYHAHTINTPLLGWVGKDDRHVNWTQSVELYLALRRLKKDHVLLVYPGEKHVILNREKQKDLSRRIREWMDHYLRGHPKKEWMLVEMGQ